MKHPLRTITILFAGLFLASCATTVPVKVTKPAEFDLEGARTIAVLPFGFPSQLKGDNLKGWELALARYMRVDGNPAEKYVAKTLTTAIQAGLIKAEYYKVSSGSALDDYLRNPVGTPPSDVYLTGELTQLSEQVTDVSYTSKDKNNKSIVVPQWKREVTLSFRYEAIDSGTRMVFGAREVTLTDSATADTPSKLQTVESLAYGLIYRHVPIIIRQVQPTEVTEHLTLMADSTKDPQMKEADQLVKDGFVEKARLAYAAIYAAQANLAAGYNAALLLEATGDLDGALVLMRQLADTSNLKDALKQVRRMEIKKAEQEVLKQQTSKKR